MEAFHSRLSAELIELKKSRKGGEKKNHVISLQRAMVTERLVSAVVSGVEDFPGRGLGEIVVVYPDDGELEFCRQDIEGK